MLIVSGRQLLTLIQQYDAKFNEMIFQKENKLPRKEENGKFYVLKFRGCAIFFLLKEIRFIDETGIHIPEKNAFHLFRDDHHVLPDRHLVRQDGHHVGKDRHHVGKDGHHVGKDGHHVGMEGHPIVPDGHHVGPDRHLIRQDGHHVTPSLFTK